MHVPDFYEKPKPKRPREMNYVDRIDSRREEIKNMKDVKKITKKNQKDRYENRIGFYNHLINTKEVSLGGKSTSKTNIVRRNTRSNGEVVSEMKGIDVAELSGISKALKKFIKENKLHTDPIIRN